MSERKHLFIYTTMHCKFATNEEQTITTEYDSEKRKVTIMRGIERASIYLIYIGENNILLIQDILLY